MAINIRRGERSDADAISAILSEAFAEYRPLYTPGGYLATTPAPKEILPRFAEGPLWIAFTNGLAAGTVSAVKKTDGLYIRSMAVRPSIRGAGVGKLLLQTVIAYAAEERCSRLYLSTTPF